MLTLPRLCLYTGHAGLWAGLSHDIEVTSSCELLGKSMQCISLTLSIFALQHFSRRQDLAGPFPAGLCFKPPSTAALCRGWVSRQNMKGIQTTWNNNYSQFAGTAHVHTASSGMMWAPLVQPAGLLPAHLFILYVCWILLYLVCIWAIRLLRQE